MLKRTNGMSGFTLAEVLITLGILTMSNPSSVYDFLIYIKSKASADVIAIITIVVGIVLFFKGWQKTNLSILGEDDGIHMLEKLYRRRKLNRGPKIVAVGGGSSIDTAKAVGIILTNPEFSDVVSLDGVAPTKNKCMPIIALPTTAGTAAEVTINYVITDETRVKKMVCVDVHDIPVVAIVDPDLMQGMPQAIAASTGMDALTHAMEGYITKAGWLIPDMFHLNSMALLYKNLEKAANAKDRTAVDNVAYAQYIAGMGFSNVGLGIVHSMAHQLGAVYDTPHGIANAMLLPVVMRFNGVVCANRFREILVNIGRPDAAHLNDQDVINTFVWMIGELSKSVGVTQTVKDTGCKEEDIEMLAEKSGVELPTLEGQADNKQLQLKAKVYEINKLAAEFYHENLYKPNAKPAQEYVKKRKLDNATLKNFLIGYSGSFNELYTMLKQKGFNYIALGHIHKSDYNTNEKNYLLENHFHYLIDYFLLVYRFYL